MNYLNRIGFDFSKMIFFDVKERKSYCLCTDVVVFISKVLDGVQDTVNFFNCEKSRDCPCCGTRLHNKPRINKKNKELYNNFLGIRRID